MYPLLIEQVALAFSVLTGINWFLFILYVYDFVTSNKFRASLALFMLSAFSIGIFDAALFFLCLQLSYRGHINIESRSPL